MQSAPILGVKGRITVSTEISGLFDNLNDSLYKNVQSSISKFPFVENNEDFDRLMER